MPRRTRIHLDGRNDKERQGAYRALFRAHLDRAAIDDIRLALTQNAVS